MSLKVSKQGLDLIKKYEGCRLKAYQDSVGVWTIGWGTTSSVKSVTGVTIKSGLTCTQAQADKWLEDAVNAKFVPLVNKYDAKYHWTQSQLDALVSFAYNIGSIDGLTAKGTRSIAEISAKIPSYNKAGGKVLTGLTRRRNDEKAMFDKNSTPIDQPTATTVTYTKTNFIKDLFGSSVIDVKKLPTVSKTKNSKHSCIKPLQKYLNAIGYSCGTPDGVYGAKCHSAVIKWQKDNKLTSDGVIGVNTWKKMLGV